MSGGWVGSTRAARLPQDWPQRTAYVWARDGDTCWICNQNGADTIDHKNYGDDHSVENLAPVHDRTPPHCHRYKSSREGNAVRWRYKQARPQEKHPGLLE
jgi:5-methylcytosine-specific restriction protein A